MALTKCRECGQQVSDRAPTCPHCGAPASVPARTIVATALGGVLAAAATAGLLFARSGGGSPPVIVGAIGIGAVVIGLALVVLVVRLRGGVR